MRCTGWVDDTLAKTLLPEMKKKKRSKYSRTNGAHIASNIKMKDLGKWKFFFYSTFECEPSPL